MAFRHFKIRVRKSLTPSYMGANDFEDAVMDYIICHLDLYDSQSSVNVSVGSLIGASLLLMIFTLNSSNSETHSVLLVGNGKAETSSMHVV